MKNIIKNKEVFLDFEEYDSMIRSESWKIFAAITARSI